MPDSRGCNRETLRAEYERHHGLAAVQGLALAIDPRADSINIDQRPSGTDLGVNARSCWSLKQCSTASRCRSMRSARSAVGNKRGHVARHAHVHLGGGSASSWSNGLSGLHSPIYAQRNTVSPLRARHLPVYFRQSRRERSATPSACSRPWCPGSRNRCASGGDTCINTHIERQVLRSLNRFSISLKKSACSRPCRRIPLRAHFHPGTGRDDGSGLRTRPRVVRRAQRLHVNDFDVGEAGALPAPPARHKEKAFRSRLNPDARAGMYDFQRLTALTRLRSKSSVQVILSASAIACIGAGSAQKSSLAELRNTPLTRVILRLGKIRPQ